MSQEKLGKAIGLTFQQVQKYERGTNRLGSSRLFDVSQVLDVPVSFFFEEMPSVAGHERHQAASAAHQRADDSGLDPMAKRETLELVRAYYRIPDAHLRRRLYDLAKALGTSTSQAK